MSNVETPKVVTSKVEFDDAEIPHGVLHQVADRVAITHGAIKAGETLPAGVGIELHKQGKQPNGKFLTFMTLKFPSLAESASGLVKVA
jgi:hypothetical protein